MLKVRPRLSKEALADIIESSGVDFKRNAISYIFKCPRCAKSNKLYIRRRDGRYVCWVCAEREGYEGYNVDLPLSELLGGKRREYASQLWGGDHDVLQSHIDIELVDHWGEFDDDSYMGEAPLDIKIWDMFEHHALDQPKGKPGADYLIRRGLDMELAKVLDIRYSARQNRVCFPMFIEGKQYGWQGRYCGDNQFIHKADTCLSTGVAGNFVMFGDTIEKFGHAILAEGPMDAIKLMYCGGACASLGKGVSEAQIRWIAEAIERAANPSRRLYIALDRDAGPEINKVMAAAREFGLDTWMIMPPPHRKDFGDCTFDEAWTAFCSAIRINPNQLIMTLGEGLIAPY